MNTEEEREFYGNDGREKEEVRWEKKPIGLLIRIILCICGVLMLKKYWPQIATGTIEWAQGARGDPEYSYIYRTVGPEGLIAAAVTFIGWAVGFLGFAVFPRFCVKNIKYVVLWYIICIIAMFAMRHFSIHIATLKS